MIFVSIGVIIQGIYETGGVEKMYNINKDNGENMIYLFINWKLIGNDYTKNKPEDSKNGMYFSSKSNYKRLITKQIIVNYITKLIIIFQNEDNIKHSLNVAHKINYFAHIPQIRTTYRYD